MWTVARGWLLLGGCQDPTLRAEEREQTLLDLMDQLEERVSGVRAAIVRGDLPDARARAGAAIPALRPLPEASGPDGLEPLRLALAGVSGAPTVQEAASAFGGVVDACARCHTRSDGVAAARPAWKVPSTRPAEMARHAVQVDRLWLALIRPSEPDLAAAVAAIDRDAEAPDATGIDQQVRALAHRVRDAAPDRRGEAFGDLLAACADCHTATRPAAVPRIDGVPLPDLRAEMDDHFLDALGLQLALMAGDLEQVHQAAARLEVLPEEAVAPSAAAFLDRVRSAAGRARAAATLADAGRAAGELALACAGCHTASGGGPKDPIPAPPTEPHLASHVYGAWWMGFGVYAPDERAWKAGATALAGASLLPSGRATPAQLQQDQAIHALAARAVTATEPVARAAIWGELLVACSSCHLGLERP